jgi:hypothetical protein
LKGTKVEVHGKMTHNIHSPFARSLLYVCRQIHVEAFLLLYTTIHADDFVKLRLFLATLSSAQKSAVTYPNLRIRLRGRWYGVDAARKACAGYAKFS